MCKSLTRFPNQTAYLLQLETIFPQKHIEPDVHLTQNQHMIACVQTRGKSLNVNITGLHAPNLVMARWSELLFL